MRLVKGSYSFGSPDGPYVNFDGVWGDLDEILPDGTPRVYCDPEGKVQLRSLGMTLEGADECSSQFTAESGETYGAWPESE